MHSISCFPDVIRIVHNQEIHIACNYKITEKDKDKTYRANKLVSRTQDIRVVNREYEIINRTTDIKLVLRTTLLVVLRILDYKKLSRM